MSVYALSWVLRHSTVEGSARLVLISLANHASGDGGDAYPSIETMRREANLKSRRTVQNALRRLVEEAAIEIQEEPGPRGQGRFRVLCGDDAGGAQSTTGAKEGGAIHDAKGAQSTTGGGAIDDSRVYEPSLEPTTKPSSDAMLLFSEWQRVFDKPDAVFSPARKKAVKRALEEEPDVDVLIQALLGFKIHRQRKPGAIELGDIFSTFRNTGDLRTRIEWMRSLAVDGGGEKMDPDKKARLVEEIRYTLSLSHRPERQRAERARQQLIEAGFEIRKAPAPVFVEVIG